MVSCEANQRAAGPAWLRPGVATAMAVFGRGECPIQSQTFDKIVCWLSPPLDLRRPTLDFGLRGWDQGHGARCGPAGGYFYIVSGVSFGGLRSGREYVYMGSGVSVASGSEGCSVCAYNLLAIHMASKGFISIYIYKFFFRKRNIRRQNKK